MFPQTGQSFFTESCYRQLAGLCKCSHLSTLLNMDITTYMLYLILQVWLLSVSGAPVPVDVFTSTRCAKSQHVCPLLVLPQLVDV